MNCKKTRDWVVLVDFLSINGLLATIKNKQYIETKNIILHFGKGLFYYLALLQSSQVIY